MHLRATNNMMKVFSLLAFAVTTIIVVVPVAVRAVVIEPYIRLNNGITDSTKRCTNDEWNQVTAAMDLAMGDRRQLNSDEKHRQLDRCGCWYCHYRSGCPGSIGRRELSSLRPGAGRELASCTESIIAVNNTLNAFATGDLSSSCKLLIASPRSIACYETAPCAVDSVKLWHGGTQQGEAFPESGGQICNSTKLSFEAIPAFEYGSIYFSLTGPGTTFSRTDWVAPYFLYGNSGYSAYSAYRLSVGNYSLRMGTEDPAKGKTINFQVNNC